MECSQSLVTGNEQRNYAIDALRIISMLMIISLHFFAYNPAVNTIDAFSVSGILTRVLRSISAISVNCYILISGYYLMKFQFRLKKLLRIMAEVWGYSVLIYWVLVIEGSVRFSIQDMFLALAPSLTREYWFVTSYIGVYLLSPLMKKILNRIDKKIHGAMVTVGFLLFVVYYNFFFFCDNLNFGGSTGIVWFIYLYVCGSYIYRFDSSELKSNVKKYIVCAFLSLGSQLPFLLAYAVTGKDIFLRGSTVFDSVYNSIFVFVSSILFFKIFANAELKNNSVFVKRMIGFFAKGSFAVYLIHDNKHMRGYLWEHLALDVAGNPIIFLLYWILTVISIYVICSFIDAGRQKFEKLCFIKIDKRIDQVEIKLKKFFEEVIIERM